MDKATVKLKIDPKYLDAFKKTCATLEDVGDQFRKAHESLHELNETLKELTQEGFNQSTQS